MSNIEKLLLYDLSADDIGVKRDVKPKWYAYPPPLTWEPLTDSPAGFRQDDPLDTQKVPKLMHTLQDCEIPGLLASADSDGWFSLHGHTMKIVEYETVEKILRLFMENQTDHLCPVVMVGADGNYCIDRSCDTWPKGVVDIMAPLMT